MQPCVGLPLFAEGERWSHVELQSVNWRNLSLPRRVDCLKVTITSRYGFEEMAKAVQQLLSDVADIKAHLAQQHVDVMVQRLSAEVRKQQGKRQ